MKAVSTLFPRLVPYVPGVPDPMAQQALVDAAITFCEDSVAVRVDLDPFQTTPDVATYVLDSPSQQRSIRVVGVKLDGIELAPAKADSHYSSDQPSGTPNYYTSFYNEDEELVLQLFDPPDSVQTLQVYVATCPTRDASQFDDRLVGQWQDAVVNGALGRLFAIPSTSFTDHKAAMIYADRATVLTRRARVDANFGKVRTSLRVNPIPFA
jgi:hypothetical protein